jgi:hypothetical protein
VDSPTGAMRDLYARHEADMGAARRALAAQPGQVGALIYMGTRWVGLDLLAGPRLFGRAWPRLCAGYVADTIGREPRRWQWLDAGVSQLPWEAEQRFVVAVLHVLRSLKRSPFAPT